MLQKPFSILGIQMISLSFICHFVLNFSFDESEHPIVAQLGGNNADYLAKAGKILQDKGYDEINLNCGCPSNTVSVHLLIVLL